jgi:hypothetical protein
MFQLIINHQAVAHNNLNHIWIIILIIWLICNESLVGGIPTYPSEKYEFVSWDDEIPNMMGKS